MSAKGGLQSSTDRPTITVAEHGSTQGAAQAGIGGLQLSDMLASRYMGNGPFSAPALTDDFAPVERYTLVLLRQ